MRKTQHCSAVTARKAGAMCTYKTFPPRLSSDAPPSFSLTVVSLSRNHGLHRIRRCSHAEDPDEAHKNPAASLRNRRLECHTGLSPIVHKRRRRRYRLSPRAKHPTTLPSSRGRAAPLEPELLLTRVVLIHVQLRATLLAMRTAARACSTKRSPECGSQERDPPSRRAEPSSLCQPSLMQDRAAWYRPARSNQGSDVMNTSAFDQASRSASLTSPRTRRGSGAGAPPSLIAMSRAF